MNNYHPLSSEYVCRFGLTDESASCLIVSLAELRALRLSNRYELSAAELLCQLAAARDIRALSIAFGEARGFVKALLIDQFYKKIECDPLLRVFVNIVEKMCILLKEASGEHGLIDAKEFVGFKF